MLKALRTRRKQPTQAQGRSRTRHQPNKLGSKAEGARAARARRARRPASATRETATHSPGMRLSSPACTLHLTSESPPVCAYMTSMLKTRIDSVCGVESKHQCARLSLGQAIVEPQLMVWCTHERTLRRPRMCACGTVRQVRDAQPQVPFLDAVITCARCTTLQPALLRTRISC